MDPRPDLTRDSAAWERLLQATFIQDGHDQDGLYGTLHGLRCLGFILETYRGGVRLVPDALHIDDYGDWRERYLAPHRERLIGLLRQAA